MRENKKIAIISQGNEGPIGTFIVNYIQYLPFEKIIIYGGSIPYLVWKGKPVPILYRKILSLYYIIFSFNNKEKINQFKRNRLTRILKKNHIDCVLVETLTGGAEVLESCMKNTIPLIPIAIGFDISQHDVLKTYETKYRKLFKYSTNIIVVANTMKPKIIELGGMKDKIEYSPIGARDEFFTLNPSLESKNILAVGRFEFKKCPHITILAFNEVLKKHPEAKLYFAGGGILKNICEDIVKALRIESQVVFLNWITQEEQRTLLENSSIFIQHSRTSESGDQEGTPVAILEASASGLPVVATKHAGIPDTVIEGETGYLVEEGDIFDMAEKITLLLNSVDLRKEIGKKGREFIYNNFSMKKHIEKVTDIINKV